MQKLEKILEEIKEIKDGNRKEKLYAKYPPNSKNQEILNSYSQGYEDGTDNFYNVMAEIIRKHMNDGWIPVDNPPKTDYETVFAVDKKDYYFVAVYTKEHGFRTNDIIADADDVVAYCLFEPYHPERTITMTENEAIEKIKDLSDRGYPTLRTAKEIAIKALEEIQHYREIGTVEELKNVGIVLIKRNKTLERMIDECMEYEKIGTVEECRKAVEKQKPKKPKELDTEYGYFICGNCGGAIAYTDDFTSHKYCLNCGQAIQWSENLEGMEDE